MKPFFIIFAAMIAMTVAIGIYFSTQKPLENESAMQAKLDQQFSASVLEYRTTTPDRRALQKGVTEAHYHQLKTFIENKKFQTDEDKKTLKECAEIMETLEEVTEGQH